jgi:hypothetical protein
MTYKRKTQSAKCKVKTQIFKFLVFSFGFVPFVLNFTLSYAQPISSTEMINNAKLYDGKIVTYEGEVIGDIMGRGDYAWMNVNDGKNAIGIWVKASLARDISYTGSYKSIGDVVEINGVFNRACPEHGGDLDIHAISLRKIATGRFIQERLNQGKKGFSIILLGILCIVWILTLLKRK